MAELVRKDDAVFFKEPDTEEIFLLVEDIPSEWDEDGDLTIERDGIRIDSPAKADPARSLIVETENAPPAFVQKLANQNLTWVMITDGKSKIPQPAFNRCRVHDQR